MRTCKVIISKEAPGQRNTLWLKPEGNSFVAYLLNGTRWVPIEIVDDNDTATLVDDAVAESSKKLKASLVGRSSDTKNSNTINGAKAYADNVGETVYGEIIGEDTDAGSNMTLWGLKNYIDAKIEELG